METEDTRPVESKYAHLPPRIRREDLRTSQNEVSYGEMVAEADRERDWMLRTTGLFL